MYNSTYVKTCFTKANYLFCFVFFFTFFKSDYSITANCNPQQKLFSTHIADENSAGQRICLVIQSLGKIQISQPQKATQISKDSAIVHLRAWVVSKISAVHASRRSWATSFTLWLLNTILQDTRSLTSHTVIIIISNCILKFVTDSNNFKPRISILITGQLFKTSKLHNTDRFFSPV